MQAVIMAGGKGTRLSDIAKDIPKPMVRIKGKPLLQYQIENLRENGIVDITLVIGYLGDVIQKYFEDGEKYGVNINYYVEKEPLGTAGALVTLSKKFEDNFILLFGDLFIDIDFDRFVQAHTKKKADVTLFTHPNGHPYDSDLVEINWEGRVEKWLPKNQPREIYMNLVNAGIYVINKNIFKGMEVEKKIDLEKDIIIPGLTKFKIYSYSSSEYVKDLGTPERYEAVIKDVETGLPVKKNFSHKQKAIFIDRDGTINKYVGFLNDIRQMELKDTVAEAIRNINNSEFLAIVITNQPVVARGEVTLTELDDIHKKMYALLGNNGAYVDALYYCPHHPDKGFDGEVKELKIDCNCRKPKVGLIQKAVQDYNIDLTYSWFVGDTSIDIMTGKNAGTRTILIEGGDKHNCKKYDVEPDARKNTLLEAVEYILGDRMQC